jgi:hypothetical protein
MAASDDFKAQLKAGKIVDALTLALGEAIELEVTTWVSTESDTDASQPSPGNRIRTRINIVDGDIDNEVGSAFVGNASYAELRQFHLAQVKEGREIIQHNLVTLQQIFTVMANTLSQLPPGLRRRPDVENPALSPSNQMQPTPSPSASNLQALNSPAPQQEQNNPVSPRQALNQKTEDDWEDFDLEEQEQPA